MVQARILDDKPRLISAVTRPGLTHSLSLFLQGSSKKVSLGIVFLAKIIENRSGLPQTVVVIGVIDDGWDSTWGQRASSNGVPLGLILRYLSPLTPSSRSVMRSPSCLSFVSQSSFKASSKKAILAYVVSGAAQGTHWVGTGGSTIRSTDK
jgi:hypothetical protein